MFFVVIGSFYFLFEIVDVLGENVIILWVFYGKFFGLRENKYVLKFVRENWREFVIG